MFHSDGALFGAAMKRSGISEIIGRNRLIWTMKRDSVELPGFAAVRHEDRSVRSPFSSIRHGPAAERKLHVDMQRTLFQNLPKVPDEIRPARRNWEMRCRDRQFIVDRSCRECLLIFAIRDCFEAGAADASL